MPETGKPKVYVSGFFCDRAIRDTDNLLTAIQITHGYSVNPTVLPVTVALPIAAPEEGSRHAIWIPLDVAAVINFMSESPADFVFRLKSIGPTEEFFTGIEPHAIHTSGGQTVTY